MIVPGRQRRRRGVQILKIRVEPVLGIAVAIALQRSRFGIIAMLADRGRAWIGEFIDVIAEESDEVGILVREMAIGREIAILIIGAGNEAEPHPLDLGAARRRGADTADAALRVAR